MVLSSGSVLIQFQGDACVVLLLFNAVLAWLFFAPQSCSLRVQTASTKHVEPTDAAAPRPTLSSSDSGSQRSRSADRAFSVLRGDFSDSTVFWRDAFL